MVNIEKPWGREIIWAKTKDYVGKFLLIDQGKRLSLQHHEIKEETLYVLSGKVKVTLGTDLNNLTEEIYISGRSFHVPPKCIHRIEAIETANLIEVSTNHLDDVVRHADDYSRT